MAVAGVAVDQGAAVAVAMVTTITLAAEERCGRGWGCRPVAFFRQSESLRQQACTAGRLRRGRGAQQVPPLLWWQRIIRQVVALATEATPTGHKVEEKHAQQQTTAEEKDVDGQDVTTSCCRHRSSSCGAS